MDPTPIQQSILKEMIDSGFAYQIKADINNNNPLDKLYSSCVRSISTQVVRRNNNMTLTIDKLKEMNANLWDPYDLPC